MRNTPLVGGVLKWDGVSWAVMAVRLSPSSCKEGDGSEGGGVIDLPGTGEEERESFGVRNASFSS